MITILYLIDLVHGLGVALMFSIFALMFAMCVIVFNVCDSYYAHQTEECLQKIRESCYPHFKLLLLLIVIKCILPSEKTMYLMLGTDVISESGVPSKVIQILNKKLDEYLLEQKK